jgi:hypothetical protein
VKDVLAQSELQAERSIDGESDHTEGDVEGAEDQHRPDSSDRVLAAREQTYTE